MTVGKTHPEYSHIPVTEHPNGLLEVSQLPEKIVVLMNVPNKMHFCKKNNIYEGEMYDNRKGFPIEKGKGLCGRDADEPGINYQPEIRKFCEDCLDEMNEILSECLFDSEEGQFYHPVQSL